MAGGGFNKMKCEPTKRLSGSMDVLSLLDATRLVPKAGFGGWRRREASVSRRCPAAQYVQLGTILN